MKRIQYVVTIDFDDPGEGADAEAELLDAIADLGCYHRVKIGAACDQTVEIGESIRGVALVCVKQLTINDSVNWPDHELSDAEMANLLDGLVGAGRWRRVPEYNCWLAILSPDRVGVFGRSGRYVEVTLPVEP